MAPLSAIIFDVDGTLIDTVDFHAEAWQRAFQEFGKEIPFEDIRHQIGKGGDQLLPYFLGKKEADGLGKKIERRRGEIYKAEYLPRVQAFRDVPALFERIRSDGKQIALASSAPKEELKIYKRLLGLEELTQNDTSSDDADKSKPHPDIFQAALEGLTDVKPAQALAVGDTPWDAQAAKSAGLRIVGVLSGGFPEMELRRAGCENVYRDPRDLLAHYGEWAKPGP